MKLLASEHHSGFPQVTEQGGGRAKIRAQSPNQRFISYNTLLPKFSFQPGVMGNGILLWKGLESETWSTSQFSLVRGPDVKSLFPFHLPGGKR